MDIKYINEDFQFFYRVSALILDKEETKILIFNVEGRNFYMLPGGKVNQYETSLEAIKRELKEELGWSNFEFSFLGITENFVKDKGYNNQSIDLMYKAVYQKEIEDINFKGLEGNWINFKWIDINDINDYVIFPSEIKNILNDTSRIYHYIEKVGD